MHGDPRMQQRRLIHRYVATTTTRSAGDEEALVYQFDGTIAPDRGMPGTEDPQNRVASPWLTSCARKVLIERAW